MKVGDYVRTKYGIKRITDIICGQDIRFDNTDGFDEDLLNYHDYDGISKNSHTWEEIVIGEPKEKPIDLIQVGDYVNGNRVKALKGDIESHKINNEKDVIYTEYINDYDEWCGYEEDEIKSIVTKEQFESMEYKVGE